MTPLFAVTRYRTNGIEVLTAKNLTRKPVASETVRYRGLMANALEHCSYSTLLDTTEDHVIRCQHVSYMQL